MLLTLAEHPLRGYNVTFIIDREKYDYLILDRE